MAYKKILKVEDNKYLTSYKRIIKVANNKYVTSYQKKLVTSTKTL